MHINSRPLAPSPYEGLDVPTFTLSSRTLTDGAPMPESATARAGSLSPDLTWEGFPTHTASFMVTCFDPDAPTPVALDRAGYSRLYDAPGRGGGGLGSHP